MDWANLLRKRSKREWKRLGHQLQYNCRIWLQEHGELALIAGLLTGIVVVLAFKLFVTLAILAVVIGMIIWALAPDDDGVTPSADEPKLHSDENTKVP
jgi:hypothetical protein